MTPQAAGCVGSRVHRVQPDAIFFFFSSRRRHTRCGRDWSSECALPICTFATDDFYGLLDENEGLFTNTTYSGVDVTIGRMPVNTQQQARAMVDKVEQYLSKDNTGRWKNV